MVPPKIVTVRHGHGVTGDHLGIRAVNGERVPVLLCIRATSALYYSAATAWLARRTGAGVFLTARACAALHPLFDGKPDAVGSLEDLLGLDGDGGGLNMQNYNRKPAEGVDLRRCIVARPGCQLAILPCSALVSFLLLLLRAQGLLASPVLIIQ